MPGGHSERVIKKCKVMSKYGRAMGNKDLQNISQLLARKSQLTDNFNLIESGYTAIRYNILDICTEMFQ